LIFFFKEEGLG